MLKLLPSVLISDVSSSPFSLFYLILEINLRGTQYSYLLKKYHAEASGQ